MFYEVLLEGQLEWSIPWLLGLVCIAVLYIFLVKHFTNIKMNYKQPILLFFCLSLTYLSMGSPVAGISHYSFSLHMIQMSIIYFIIPPLFLLSIPKELFQHLDKYQPLKVKNLLLSPMVALYTFATFFLMYHLPFVLNILSQSPFMHKSYSILLFILAIRMWWPIATPDLKQDFSKKQRKRYAFLSGIILMPACLIFIANAFMDGMNNPFVAEITATLCIPSSSHSIEILPFPFNTKYDQIAAGLFMMGMHKLGLILTVKLGTRSLL